MKPKTKRLLSKLPYFIVMAFVLVLAAATPMLLLERLFWEESLWGSSYTLGYVLAKESFRRGEARLLELSTDINYMYTGRKEGEFEIWSWPSYRLEEIPHLPLDLLERPGKVEAESFVDGWNKAMRRMADDARTAKDSVDTHERSEPSLPSQREETARP